VIVLAVDLPWIAPAVPALRARLAAAAPVCAAVALVDADSRPNYLVAAWRRSALVGALLGLDRLDGAPMRALYDAVRWTDLPDPDGWGRDIDTPDDLPSPNG